MQGILDRQVDGIEPVFDNFEKRLGELEEQVLAKPRNQDLASLVALRRNILHLRRWLGLQRDVVLRLARQEFDLVSPAEALDAGRAPWPPTVYMLYDLTHRAYAARILACKR